MHSAVSLPLAFCCWYFALSCVKTKWVSSFPSGLRGSLTDPEVGGIAVAFVCVSVCLFRNYSASEGSCSLCTLQVASQITVPSKLDHSGLLLLLVCEIPRCHRATSFPPSADLTAQFQWTRMAVSDYGPLPQRGNTFTHWSPATVCSSFAFGLIDSFPKLHRSAPCPPPPSARLFQTFRLFPHILPSVLLK